MVIRKRRNDAIPDCKQIDAIGKFEVEISDLPAAVNAGSVSGSAGKNSSRRPVPVLETRAAAQVVMLDVQSNPARTVSGGFLMIDHAISFGDRAIISGWRTVDLEPEFSELIAQTMTDRDDATQATGKECTGFIAVVAMETDATATTITMIDGNLVYRAHVACAGTAIDAEMVLRPLMKQLSPLLEYLVVNPTLGKLLFHCPDLPARLRRELNGHIDEFRVFDGFGIVTQGWALSAMRAELWLVSNSGKWSNLKEAMRYDRHDIDNAFSEDFGTYTAGAGFFCALEASTVDASPLRLIASTPDGLYTVCRAEGRLASADPISYARWAFSLPLPSTSFNERLERHDGALLEQLIANRRSVQPVDYQVWDAGKLPTAPAISVIVPLYGRADFIEHQLIEFCKDPEFTNGTVELLYVVDDPKILESVRAGSANLNVLYRVPFRVVWGGLNRGYSGANNLGCRVARGSTIIFLNSDVFTKEAGWASEMVRVLDKNKDVRAVGARLEYSDGSLQHLGISFNFASDWGVWLNNHPRCGTDVPARAAGVQEVPAATGACLAVRSNELKAVGGMDEGFLIGDFEDSDLCFRLKQLGGRIVVLPNTRHVHLERQSFRTIGDESYRFFVTRYNAWRHNKRWANTLEKLNMEKSK